MKNDILQDVFNNIDDKLIFDADRENHNNTIHFTKWIAIIVAINVLFSASIVTVFAVLGKSDTSPTILSDEEILLIKIREANKYSNIFEKVTSFTAVDDKVLLGEQGTYVYAENDVYFSDIASRITVKCDNIYLWGPDNELCMNSIQNHPINWLDSSLFKDLYEVPYTDAVYEITLCDNNNGYMELYKKYKRIESMPEYKEKISIMFDVETLLIKQYTVTSDPDRDDNIFTYYKYKIFYNLKPNETAQKNISLIREYVNLYKQGEVCNITFIDTEGHTSLINTYVKGAKVSNHLDLSYNSFWHDFVAIDDCTIIAENFKRVDTDTPLVCIMDASWGVVKFEDDSFMWIYHYK